MNKLMNDPNKFVDEMLDGLLQAHPSMVRTKDSSRAITRAVPPKSGRVGVVSGGGSGHLPLFVGYVGSGLLDACAVGNVFEGPNVDSCLAAIKAADAGAGVLCLYGNYGGDRMNFSMASEMCDLEGITTSTVLGRDDIASAKPELAEKRRGVAGIVFAYKAAGAAADAGGSLAQVAAMAQRAVDRTQTIGVAWAPCQLPGADQPNFQLAPGECEFGIGIHGEPGLWRAPLGKADEIVAEMIKRLLAEAPANSSGKVSVLINSLGATSPEELYIVYRATTRILKANGIEVVMPLVGRYATSMEMAGISVSISHIDEDLARLYSAPACCPFWTVA